MKFLIDNALSPFISIELNKQGYDANHVRDLEMSAATDLQIFELAIQQNRIIISADTYFGTLLTMRESAKPSFILFRQTNKDSIHRYNFY